MALVPTIATVARDDWNSVCAFNKDTQRAFQKIGSLLLGPGSIPAFSSATLSSLTSSRLLASDSTKSLVSVANLSTWIAGTTNQIIITDDGDGTATLSCPQDIHTGATPTFDGLISTGDVDIQQGQKLYFDG